MGPNNVGKSQFLYDIFKRIGHQDTNSLLLNELDFEPPNSFEELIYGLKVGPNPDNPNGTLLRGMGPSLSNGEQIDLPISFDKEKFNKEDFRSHLIILVVFKLHI